LEFGFQRREVALQKGPFNARDHADERRRASVRFDHRHVEDAFLLVAERGHQHVEVFHIARMLRGGIAHAPVMEDQVVISHGCLTPAQALAYLRPGQFHAVR